MQKYPVYLADSFESHIISLAQDVGILDTKKSVFELYIDLVHYWVLNTKFEELIPLRDIKINDYITWYISTSSNENLWIILSPGLLPSPQYYKYRVQVSWSRSTIYNDTLKQYSRSILQSFFDFFEITPTAEWYPYIDTINLFLN